MHFKLHTIYTALTTLILILGIAVIPGEAQVIEIFGEVVDGGVGGFVNVGPFAFGALVIDNDTLDRTVTRIGGAPPSDTGLGVVLISNGGIMNVGFVNIGFQPGSVGMAVVDGGSTFSAGNVLIGSDGTGTVIVSEGSSFNARLVALGVFSPDSAGILRIDNSTLTVADVPANTRLIVGSFGTGLLEVSSSASVDVNRDPADTSDSRVRVVVGSSNGGSGTLNVRNPGSVLRINGGLELLSVGAGRGLNSTLNITDGGQVILENLPVSQGPPVGDLEGKAFGGVGVLAPTVDELGSTGTVVVSGVGSLLDTGRLFSCAMFLFFPTEAPDPDNLIEGGAASVTVSDGGVIRADNIFIGPDCVVRGDGTLDVPGGGAVTLKGILSPGNSPGTITIINGDLILDGGTIQIEIDGPDPGQFDVVKVENGNVILNVGSIIEITVAEEVDLEEATTLTFLEAPTIEGSVEIQLVFEDPDIQNPDPFPFEPSESGEIVLTISEEGVTVSNGFQIDIKPGSEVNSINLRSKGLIPVAIYSSDTFDATTVDLSEMKLAGASVRRCHDEDINEDGVLDLICHFELQELNIDVGAEVAVLTATLAGDPGDPISGQDTVNIVQR